MIARYIQGIANIDYWRLLKYNPNFRYLWIGENASSVGNLLNNIAMLALLFQLTGSGLAIGLIVVASRVPLLLLGPIAGTIADRMDRRKVMISCDLTAAALALGYLLITAPDKAWLVYVFTSGLMTTTLFFNPAKLALLPTIVDQKDLTVANSLRSLTGGIITVLGAAAGGIIGILVGLQWLFILNSLSFLLSALCVWLIRLPHHSVLYPFRESPSRLVWGDLRVGLNYMIHTPFILLLTTVTSLVWSSWAGATIVLYPVIAGGQLQTAVVGGIGLLYVCSGSGSIVGSFLAKRLLGSDPSQIARSLGVGFLAQGILIAIFGQMQTLLLAAVILFMIETILIIPLIAQLTLFMTVVPNSVRGKVFANREVLTSILIMITGIVVGWGTAYIHVQMVALIVGLMIAGCGLLWMIFLQFCTPSPASD